MDDEPTGLFPGVEATFTTRKTHKYIVEQPFEPMNDVDKWGHKADELQKIPWEKLATLRTPAGATLVWEVYGNMSLKVRNPKVNIHGVEVDFSTNYMNAYLGLLTI